MCFPRQGLLDLNEGDLKPLTGLDVQHLDPVAGDGEASVILGHGPGDVDLISDTVLVPGLPRLQWSMQVRSAVCCLL